MREGPFPCKTLLDNKLMFSFFYAHVIVHVMRIY